MKNQKNYTRNQLERAMNQGGSIAGASRLLGCDRKTFKKYWEDVVENQPQVSPIQTEIPQVEYEFSDPSVKEIIEEHREKKANVATYAIIIEIADQIDADHNKIAALKEHIKKCEDILKNMKLE